MVTLDVLLIRGRHKNAMPKYDADYHLVLKINFTCIVVTVFVPNTG